LTGDGPGVLELSVFEHVRMAAHQLFADREHHVVRAKPVQRSSQLRQKHHLQE